MIVNDKMAITVQHPLAHNSINQSILTEKKRTLLNNKHREFIERYQGKTFNKLLIVSFSHRYKNKNFWHCICSCGKQTIIETYSFSSGKAKSCGCIKRTIKPRLTHGQSHTSEFHIWQGMKARCYNKMSHAFDDYGGRGIVVCNEWINSFETFFKEMGPRPSPLHSLDRIDNNLGYSKQNCRWATQKQQCRNKRINNNYTHNGVTKCLKEWAEFYTIPYKLLWRRLKHGWSFEEAIIDERLPNGSTRRIRNNITTPHRQ